LLSTILLRNCSPLEFGDGGLYKGSSFRVFSLILTFLLVTSSLQVGLCFDDLGPADVLLKLRCGVDRTVVMALLDSLGVEVLEEIPELSLLVARAPRRALSILRGYGSSFFEFLEEDLRVPPMAVPNDYYYGFQWHLRKIGAPAAWDISKGSEKVIIAVLDSGVDPGHPDLAGKLLQGYNFYDNNYDTNDVTGHGTAVAGVAAAVTDNGLGVAGVGWRCSILPVRVTDRSGYVSYSTLSKGLIYAADRGARVAVIAFRIYGGQSVSSAAKYFMDKGGLVFAAGGNTGSYVGDPDNPYIISVSGTTSSDSAWGSYGPYIDLSAPCSGIYTTIRGGGYGSMGGTSLSAAIAGGVAALIFSLNPSLGPGKVEEILESTAVDLGAPGYDTRYGWGRIDAERALRKASEISIQAVDTTPPKVSITSPSNGSTVSGNVLVRVEASDETAVAKVEIYRDGGLLATITQQPYEFSWDTGNEQNGVHRLQAKAYDKANNVGASSIIEVTVSNSVGDTKPPTVRITSPSNGARVSGYVAISVYASDESGISRVEFYIDDRLRLIDYSSPYSYYWNSGTVVNGYHTIKAIAYDKNGNRAEASITVNVSN
jgi:thermitase